MGGIRAWWRCVEVSYDHYSRRHWRLTIRDQSERMRRRKLWGPTRYGFFCFSFVFLLFSFLFSFVAFLCLPLIFARSLLYHVGMPVPLSLDFFCCGGPPLLSEVPKRRWGISCGGALLDRVCLSLERDFAAVYSGPGECSVEVCLVCWPV